MAKNKSSTTITNYRHGEKRKNNPPAKIAAEGTVPTIPKAKYHYSPRQDPALRFDSTGKADCFLELIEKAQQQTLSEQEASTLRQALSDNQPWLEWANKQEENAQNGFEVDPVALHIHERVSAQAILKAAARTGANNGQMDFSSLFADPKLAYHQAVQFYRHEMDWANRMILGDSLQVMSSLSQRESMAGKVQMIYFDPPYGIKFSSNFQPQINKRDVKDTQKDLTREPEMVKAYRDTWHLGVHSYLSYLRNRLIVAKELLADTGSIFVQISDENLHRVRQVMDEVFGAENFMSQISFRTKIPLNNKYLANIADSILWYAHDYSQIKFRRMFANRDVGEDSSYSLVEKSNGERIRLNENERNIAISEGAKPFTLSDLKASGYTESCHFSFELCDRKAYPPGSNSWKTSPIGMWRVVGAQRAEWQKTTPRFIGYAQDYPVMEITNQWSDTQGAAGKSYVVQTNEKIIQRCMLMTTDPGDLVLDPTCGSGTTAHVAERWGRRWITIDTSRVAISLARQRLLTSAYERYKIEGEDNPKQNGKGVDPAPNFVYKTVPHITLGSIARNEALDPIFAKHKPILEEKLAACNSALENVDSAVKTKLQNKLTTKQKNEGKRAITDADNRRWLLPPANRGSEAQRQKKSADYTVDLESAQWYEWEVPFDVDEDWPEALQKNVQAYRKAWRAKMDEVNACIADSAEQETLVDQPEKVSGVARVSGPFTVEAVQPPEMSLGESSEQTGSQGMFGGEPDKMQTWQTREVEPLNEMEVKNVEAYLDKMIQLMRDDGVRFPNNKQMSFSSLEPIYESGNSNSIHAEGRWAAKGEKDNDPQGEANVAVVVGPQYGPVTSPLIVDAMRSAFRRGYSDIVFAGFSFDAAAQSEIEDYKEEKIIPHLAHIRPDVNPEMTPLLKEQPGSQLFTVFGLPRINVEQLNSADSADETNDSAPEYQVIMEGVDIYNPLDSSVNSSRADKVAAWFLDSDYDGQTFCITQAFFPDRKSWDKLARALGGKNGVLDNEVFETLSGTTSLPFPAGANKRVAVKVIDPRGNEVMAVKELGE